MTEEGQQRLCSAEHTPPFTIAKLHKPRQSFSRNSALKIAELTPAKNVCQLESLVQNRAFATRFVRRAARR